MKMEPWRGGDVFLAAHVDMYGPVQALRDYLQAQKITLALASCPLAVAKIPRATLEIYQAGEKTRVIPGHANRARGLSQWLRDAWFVFYWGFRLMRRPTIYIGINNLNAVIGLVLKWLGRCSCVVYYVIDYSPQRFAARWLNGIYQRLARLAARQADLVWNLSERMRQVHCQDFGAEAKRQMIVPIGIDRSQVRVLPDAQVERQRLIIISTLYANKGVQLALQALKYLPDAHLVIVGDGPYQSPLEALARQLKVSAQVEFKGSLAHGPDLFLEIAKSRVAIATYVPAPDNYTYYADPSKPKEYLACGTPVVITRVPWIAELIAQAPMGLAIDYDALQLAAACRRLMQEDDFWRKCRQTALAYAGKWDWNKIYSQAMSEVQQCMLLKAKEA